MDITPYVEQLKNDLQNAAEVGDDQGRAAASRLLIALDPATRLVLMDALTQAAAEITAELPTGSVEVRLAGRELDFVVDAPETEQADPSGPVAPSADADHDDDAVARVTLRLPESVKRRAEDLAAQGGVSLNNWLVGIVRQATGTTSSPGRGVPPLAPGAPLPPPPGELFSGRGRKRASGWL